jgi:transcriptional regulator with XRE-family HTH domain
MPDMLWERLLEVLQDKGEVPNKYTIYLGEQLKKAREEAGLSQAELADKVYRRRPSISDMENGKMMPDLGTITLLATALDKPLLYFIPKIYQPRADRNPELTELEKEMLVHFRQLDEADQRLAIKQIRIIAEHE